MDKGTRQMLNSTEQAIIRLIESKRFGKLDEDALIDLHTRTRRARTKYRTLQRRRGAKKVPKTGSRAVATKATRRTALKAELFEDALATVSARLGKVAAANAKALRAERLAEARAVKKANAKKAAARKKPAARRKTAPARKKARTAASKRRAATARAATRRKQAKRDGR
jgi:hypothetical protein